MIHPEPIDSMIYPRYSGIATFMRLPHLTDTSQLDVAFVGVPFDTAAGYRVGEIERTFRGSSPVEDLG